MKEVLESTSHGREHRRTMRRWSPQVAARMPERELVHVSGGCTVQNRGVAHTL